MDIDLSQLEQKNQQNQAIIMYGKKKQLTDVFLTWHQRFIYALHVQLTFFTPQKS